MISPFSSADLAAVAFTSLIKWLPHNPELGVRKIVKFAGEKVDPLSVDEWTEYVYARFPKLLPIADACASVVCQLLINDIRNPFALIIVDAPASGKTIALNFFRGIDELTYFTSDFTPASFVSNIAGKSEKQLQKIDLLPRIQYKTLIIKDMAPIFADNDDVLKKRLGMMIDILDGEGYKSESGVYGSRGYSGDYLFMMLAASTNFAPRIWKMMSEYGPRIFFIGLNSKRTPKEILKEQVKGVNYKVKEHECKLMTHRLLRTIWGSRQDGVTWDKDRDDDSVIDRIADFAIFLARFRGDIRVHEERGNNGEMLAHTEPRIEDPSRINQCLYNLARGHAILHGRNYIEGSDIDVVFRIVLDSAPNPRPKIFRLLLKGKGKVTVSNIVDAIGLTAKSAKKEMHKLVQLGVCEGELEREMEENQYGVPVSPAGQAKHTLTLKEEFMWWMEPHPGYEEAFKEMLRESVTRD